MSPPNTFDNNKPVVTKSKRGRKALAVREGHIDTTGRTHIMTVRRSNPTPKKKTTAPKTIKQAINYCKRCEQNDEYIDVLNDRIGKLESLVEKLTIATKSNNTQPQPIAPQPPSFSSMRTDELVNLSNQIGVVLFDRYTMQNQLQLQMTPMPATLTPPVSPFATCEPAELTDWTGVAYPFAFQ